MVRDQEFELLRFLKSALRRMPECFKGVKMTQLFVVTKSRKSWESYFQNSWRHDEDQVDQRGFQGFQPSMIFDHKS
jgi:hypothetical protein